MQQRRNDKREGSVTVYMALTMAVLLSLFVALIESARERAIELVADCSVDLAVYSVFAEYQRELLEEYDLLFVDTSYKTKDTSQRSLMRHLEAYIDENLSPGNSARGVAKDLTDTFLEDTRVTEISYATDEGGEIFFRQAVGFMKQKYGVGYLEDIREEIDLAKENELFTKDYTAQRQSVDGQIQSIKEQGVESGEVDEDGNAIMEPVEFDNPADQVNAGRSMGILALVADRQQVSQRGVSPGRLLSRRGVHHTGDGLCGRKKAGVGGKLWFELYIKEHCGCYRMPKENGALTYQQEYIIAGKDNDTDNLKAVVTRLLALRETANVTYLFSDVEKTAEAEAMAMTIASAAGIPALTELIKVSLLFAWAFAESVWDVKSLLAGRRIPLLKTPADWHYSLEGMLSYGSDTVAEEAPEETAGQTASLAEGKLSYEDYLFLFMSLQSREALVSRTMDMAEADVRKSSGDEGFCMDDCIDHLKIEASVGSGYGFSTCTERSFSYY